MACFRSAYEGHRWPVTDLVSEDRVSAYRVENVGPNPSKDYAIRNFHRGLQATEHLPAYVFRPRCAPKPAILRDQLDRRMGGQRLSDRFLLVLLRALVD